VTQEVRAADAAGASATARAAVGFQELLDGDVEAMRTRTRRYAKRQLTWLRKLPGAHLIDVTGRTPEDVAAELIAII
jgi:tRNA dimethylallyltransferase